MKKITLPFAFNTELFLAFAGEKILSLSVIITLALDASMGRFVWFVEIKISFLSE
ncbi:hypothetical protein ACJ5N2_11095 [Aeromonas salmonicida]|uniref:hypothetical protein n=1 Tax=Aeromonas salmonicida TaxID=645 RepID=UPI0038BB1632